MTVLKKGDIVKARVLEIRFNDAYCEILNSDYEEVLNCIALYKLKNPNISIGSNSVNEPLMPGCVFDATVESISSTNYIILKKL